MIDHSGEILESGVEVLEKTSNKNKYDVFLYKMKCPHCKNIFLATYTKNRKSCFDCRFKIRDMSKKRINIEGKKFGKLLAVKDVGNICSGKDTGGSRLWLCKCDCGNEVNVTYSSLMKGTKSCGCLVSITSSNNIKKFNEKDKTNGTSLVLIKKPSKKYSNNKTGRRGVSVDRGRYRARIRFQNKLYSLGYYTNLDDAIVIREEAEKHIFGDFLSWYNSMKSDNFKINVHSDIKKINIDGTSLLMMNNRTSINNKSGTTGVCWHNKSNKWRAYIVFKREQYHLGMFVELSDAVKARKKAEELFWNPYMLEYLGVDINSEHGDIEKAIFNYIRKTDNEGE